MCRIGVKNILMVNLHLGDCTEILPTIPDGSVSEVIVDPPYGTSAYQWGEKAPYDLLPEFLRVSRGPVFWFGVSTWLRTDLLSFVVPPQRILIWYSIPVGLGAMGNGIYYSYQPIYTWRLPPTQNSISNDIIGIKGDGSIDLHPGAKPAELMSLLVHIVTRGETILDPFMGSGSVGIACKRSGREYIGIEKDERYFEIAKRRIYE